MSDLKPKHVKIELDGKEYGLLFNLNAIDDIQDKFDISISNLTDLLSDERKIFKTFKFLIMTLINEAIDDAETGEPHVTESFVGRKITPAKIPELKNTILMAFSEGTPKSEDDDPNPQSE